MALNKAALAQSLKAIFDSVSPEVSGITDPSVLREKVANDMADAIEIFVKTGSVKVAAGIPVSTTGTAAAHTGATTQLGTGVIE